MESPGSAGHPMPYRILWTWDAWICDPFDAESYVAEYRRLIDFAAEWDYNAVIIWGFIDDRHGGEASAREVARYGKSMGVRVLPGVGAGNYGGFVTSKGHKWNLDTFLEGRPELGAVTRDRPDELSDHLLCLFQQDGLDWLREGAAWLEENFEIGGVNVESNEAGGIDVCPLAEEATRQEPNRLRYAASFTDLGITVPIIYEQFKKRDPDAWVIYATYEPAWWRRQEDAWLLRDMPGDAIAQWNIELDVDDEGVPPPVERNIALIHSGGWSYHLAPFPPLWAFTQYRCFYPNLEEARQFARNQHKSGLHGFDLGNVGSPVMPDNEIVYIAYIEFARTPEMTIDEFSERFIARLYGGEAEPLVKELMLAQPKVHENVRDVWKAWVRPADGGEAVPELPVAKESDIEALSGQIELAERAHDAAHQDGKKRLDTIIRVLNEYLDVARRSREQPKLKD